jgi:excisionase family DNA binding protein
MNDHAHERDPLLSQPQAAAYLNVSVRTLQRWRELGVGPGSIKLPNGHRRYRRSELDRWLNSHGEPPGE